MLKMRLLIGGLCTTLAMGTRGLGSLLSRAYQTNAICSTSNGEDWSWMDNTQSKSPCLTAAFAVGPCVGSNYIVADLNSVNNSYSSPAGSFVSPCTCSWAVYNLLSACTVCQDLPGGIRSWADWSQNCGNLTDATDPYPAGFTIPDSVTFPNYAGVNPHSWTDARFDVNEAKQFQANHSGDYPLSSPSATSSTTPSSGHGANVGAIAGGVVGGVLVLGIGIGIALFLLCRHRRQKGQQTTVQSAMVRDFFDQHHVRSPSDKTQATGFGYHPLQASSPSSGSTRLLPQSPTSFHTHNTSMGSIGQEPSIMMSLAGYPTTPPPQGAVNSNVFPVPHGAVVPFVLERPSSSQDLSSSHDRKRSEAEAHHAEIGGLAAALAAGRMNPPAYSEQPHGHGDFGSQAPDQVSTYNSTSIVTTPSSRPPHEKSPSVGSMGSSSSSTSGGIWTALNPASFSGVADRMMDTSGIAGPSGSTPAYTGPGPNVNVPRDEKRRPTIMNQTPGDEDHNSPQ